MWHYTEQKGPTRGFFAAQIQTLFGCKGRIPDETSGTLALWKCSHFRCFPHRHPDSRQYGGCDADPLILFPAFCCWWAWSRAFSWRLHGCFPCTERN